MPNDDESHSDFTDLEDQLVDEEPSTSQRGSGRVNDGYKLTGALKPPRATTYTTSALYKQMHCGDIELNPEYQRAVVWTKDKQIGVIDSILRNYYIPPIIFAVQVYEDGSESRTCIDGKQRLTSIHLFMDGLIPHRDPYTHQKLWYKNNPSVKEKKELLPEKYRTIFSNKQIVCVEYNELRPNDERDIFKRVQLGMALTPPEKLQAIDSHRASFIREIIQTYVTEDKLASAIIPWNTARAEDFRVVVTAVLTMSKWDQKGGNKTLPGIQQLESWLSQTVGSLGGTAKKKAKGKKVRGKDNDDGDDEDDEDYDESATVEVDQSFQNKVMDTFDVVSKLATNSKYNGPFVSKSISTKLSPVEITCIFILVYAAYISPPPTSPAASDKPSFQRLSDLIFIMRAGIRQKHKDIRMNSAVSKDLLDMILQISKDPHRYYENHSSLLNFKAPNSTAKSASASTSKKRKSAVMEDDSEDDTNVAAEKDDADYRPSSTRRRRATRTTSSASLHQAAKKTGGRVTKLQKGVPPTPTSSSSPSHVTSAPPSASLPSAVPPPPMSAPAAIKDEPPSPSQTPYPPSQNNSYSMADFMQMMSQPQQLSQMQQLWSAQMMGIPMNPQMNSMFSQVGGTGTPPTLPGNGSAGGAAP